MKKAILLFVIISGLFLVSCGSKDAKDAAKDKIEELRPRNNGHFLMYYYPTHSIYTSEFGTSFTKSDTCKAYPNFITADEDGTLYSGMSGTEVTVNVSKDGGQTWQMVDNADEIEYDRASYIVVASKSKTVYALSSAGKFFVTTNGGVNWTEKTSPCVKDTTHSSPAFTSSINLAVSVDGKKILAQAWYFEEQILSISEDGGNTWTAIPAPIERNESKGVGFCADRIIYASYDQLFYTDDLGQNWFTSEPDKMLAKDSETNFWGYRTFVTDGDKFVVGVEAPSAESSKNEKNKYPGAIFLSTDAGKTFKVLDFPFAVDPTPNTSDEYIYLTFIPKKK